MEEKYNLKQLILYIVIIMVILLFFYGITVIITNRKNNVDTNNENDIVIDYEKILVQDLYNQNEASYYVFAYLKEDENIDSYDELIDTYRNLDSSLKVYMIELDSAFNKKYLGEQSNFEEKTPVFGGTTLLKIENKVIIETYEGEDIGTILNILTDNGNL